LLGTLRSSHAAISCSWHATWLFHLWISRPLVHKYGSCHMKKTCAVMCLFCIALPLALEASVNVAPPQAEPATSAPDPVAMQALQKLVVAGRDLNFNLDKDALHDQFQVEAAVHAPPDFPAAPPGGFHLNALSFLVGRDK